MNKCKAYIDALKDAIRHTHDCESEYLETIYVKEVFKNATVWEGDVEVFTVEHPKAFFCYAWGFKDDAGNWQYVAVLKVSPVDSPLKAVQAYIISSRASKP